MNLKEFFKPTMRKIIIFLILIMIWIFLPWIPFKNQIMCIIGPCNPIIRFFSLYDIIINNAISSNHLLFATPLTFIIPVIELPGLYVLASIVNFVIINKKSKLANASIIVAGILIFISKITCIINHSYYSCRYFFNLTLSTLAADYLTISVLAAGIAVAGYGIYRLFKK